MDSDGVLCLVFVCLKKKLDEFLTICLAGQGFIRRFVRTAELHQWPPRRYVSTDVEAENGRSGRLRCLQFRVFPLFGTDKDALVGDFRSDTWRRRYRAKGGSPKNDGSEDYSEGRLGTRVPPVIRARPAEVDAENCFAVLNHSPARPASCLFRPTGTRLPVLSLGSSFASPAKRIFFALGPWTSKKALPGAARLRVSSTSAIGQEDMTAKWFDDPAAHGNVALDDAPGVKGDCSELCWPRRQGSAATGVVVTAGRTKMMSIKMRNEE